MLNKKQKKMLNSLRQKIKPSDLIINKIVDFQGQIHPDGDVYIKVGTTYHYIGKLGESTFSNVPDEYYLKIKKFQKKYAQPKQQ